MVCIRDVSQKIYDTSCDANFMYKMSGTTTVKEKSLTQRKRNKTFSHMTHLASVSKILYITKILQLLVMLLISGVGFVSATFGLCYCQSSKRGISLLNFHSTLRKDMM